MIQIHPKEFYILTMQYIPIPNSTLYIDPKFVESVTHIEENSLFLLRMASGDIHAIDKEEFMKFNVWV